MALDQSDVTDRIPLTDDEIAYILRDLAPAFEIDEGVKWLPSVPPYVEELAARTAFRLGDGGYNDNTAVAYLLRHLADNGALDDFEIVTSPNAVHVLNAPSPAATASLAIGDHVATLALAD